MRAASFFALAVFVLARPSTAQESRFMSDLRREGEHIAKNCGELALKTIPGCAYTLTTDYPFHLALGSIAPENGFAWGLAFVERFTPNESWRLSWNADAVRASSGAWRAGAYMKIVRTPATSGVVVAAPGSAAPTNIAPREFAVFDLVAQAVSLETVSFFGPTDGQESRRSVYGERQAIVGGSVVYPGGGWAGIGVLRPTLIGGIRGRFLEIRPGSQENAPSIGEIYDAGAAPGLEAQDAFLELEEGIRFRPSVANGRLRFNYLLSAQQFRTSAATRGSFNRWTADLRHEIPIYRTSPPSGPREFNGPNDCAASASSAECPPVQWTRNRHGTIHFRVLVTTSTTGGDNRVPFYFQPTLGGSTLNGERLLASYPDYRFRGPRLIVLQESIEHSIWGPIGLFVQGEHGQVRAEGDAFDLGDLRWSATVGVTVRAGGFPLVNLSFSWGGGNEHVIASIDTTLLGGSTRPNLF